MRTDHRCLAMISGQTPASNVHALPGQCDFTLSEGEGLARILPSPWGERGFNPSSMKCLPGARLR